MTSLARRPAHGGATGRAKRQYCRIVHWLEEVSPELARAFRITCLEIKLHPRRDDPGVTLLYPDEELRKEIVAAAEDDTEKAVHLLGNLILLNFFGTAADFGSKTPGTLNRLSYEASVEGSSVKLPGGAVATLEPKFAPTADFEGRIAVWRVKGKLAPPTKPFSAQGVSAAERKPREPRPPKIGGDAGRLAARAQLAEAVEASMEKTLNERSTGGFNPYLSATVSILKTVGLRAPDLLPTLAPLLDYNPVICFYILAEPHLRNTSQALIPDSIFEDPSLSSAGGVVPRLHGDASCLQDFFGFFAGLDAEAARTETARIDKDVRYATNGVGICSEVVSCIAEKYDAREGGAPGAGLRQMHRDEFRFRLRQVLLGLYLKGGPWLRATPSGADFRERVGLFTRHDMPGNSLQDELVILPTAASHSREMLGALLLFTRSTCLLYQAWPLECLDLKNSRKESWRPSMLDPGLEEGLTFNYHRATYQDLVSYGPNLVVGGGGAGRPALSSSAMAELAAAVRENGGRLPAEVLGLVAGAGSGAGSGAGAEDDD